MEASGKLDCGSYMGGTTLCLFLGYLDYHFDNHENDESYFYSLIFELTRLILTRFVRQDTALSSQGTCPRYC